MTLPLNTEVERLNASAVVAGALQLHAIACSLSMKQNADAQIKNRNLAGLIAHRTLAKKCDVYTLETSCFSTAAQPALDDAPKPRTNVRGDGCDHAKDSKENQAERQETTCGFLNNHHHCLGRKRHEAPTPRPCWGDEAQPGAEHPQARQDQSKIKLAVPRLAPARRLRNSDPTRRTSKRCKTIRPFITESYHFSLVTQTCRNVKMLSRKDRPPAGSPS